MNRLKSLRYYTIIFIAIVCASSVNAFELSSRARISIMEEYNDNLYLDNENEEDDFITVISPGFQSEIRWQRTGLNAAYDLGYSMYDEHSEDDSFRHRGNLGWWWNMAQNTRFSLGDTYIKSEDISELPEEDTGRNGRDGFYSNTAFMNFNHQFGENKSVALRYAYGILDNDDETVEDNQSHKASTALTYYFSPQLGTETNVAYTNGLYDESQDFDEWVGSFRLLKNLSRHFQINGAYTHTSMTWEGEGVENDYQIYHPTLGMRYSFADDGIFAVNAGYFVQDIDNEENEDGVTVDGNIGKSWRFKQGMFSLTGTSGYDNSQLNTENLGFNVYYGAQSSLEYNFTRNVRSSVQASYRNIDYVNPEPGETERKDDFITAGCTLSWQIKRWLSSDLEYSYRNMDSNIDDNDYAVNRILLRFTLSAQSGRFPATESN